jgi:sulfhydrogenase subunit beta (sulfur reductase)
MGTGPRSTGGFDLSFIEMDDVFLVEVGSEAGAHALQPLEWERAIAYRLQLAEAEFLNAERSIQRHIENLDMLPEILLNNYEHPLWDQVGARCLSCTNCTLVCPTCFCWDVEDLTDLSGDITRRERVWDSCFNPSYSAQAGGNTRPTTKSRYRQWLTHKMGSWVEQFGESGCVGCGRCITWCPAKIDITAEIINFQEAAA